MARYAMLLVLLLASASARAQEFADPGMIAGVLTAFKFQKGAPAVQAAAADATAVRAGIVLPTSQYPVRGIDVSHYQHTIDWDKVKTAALSFAYMKATEGNDLTDDEFAANWQGAGKAGLRRGAYHFYDFCQSGASQSAHFVKTVPAGAGDLPIAIDLEVSKSCKTMPAKKSFRKSLAVFVAAVEKAYGKTPAIYINDSLYAKYFAGENDSYPIWITDARKAPALPKGTDWTFWQFSYKGTVAGIDTDVDLDVYNGGAQQFAKLDVPHVPDGPLLADSNY